jgi:hypothetical protein
VNSNSTDTDFLIAVLPLFIVQSLFHLISVVSDDVLSWLGNVGKDMGGKTHNVFVGAGRFRSKDERTVLYGID